MQIHSLNDDILTDDDYQRMADLHAQNFTHAWDADNIRNMIKADQYFGYLIKENDQIVAYLLFLDQKIECEIMTIIVDHKLRGKGIGNQILSHAIEQLKSQKYDKIMLEVNVNNHAAIKLYQQFGFEKVGLRKNYYTDLDGKKQDGLIFSLGL